MPHVSFLGLPILLTGSSNGFVKRWLPSRLILLSSTVQQKTLEVIVAPFPEFKSQFPCIPWHLLWQKNLIFLFHLKTVTNDR